MNCLKVFGVAQSKLRSPWCTSSCTNTYLYQVNLPTLPAKQNLALRSQEIFIKADKNTLYAREFWRDFSAESVFCQEICHLFNRMLLRITYNCKKFFISVHLNSLRFWTTSKFPLRCTPNRNTIRLLLLQSMEYFSRLIWYEHRRFTLYLFSFQWHPDPVFYV